MIHSLSGTIGGPRSLPHPALNTCADAGVTPQDHVLDLLKHYNLPLTRDNYLELAYPDGVPEDLDESSLPSEIRLE